MLHAVEQVYIKPSIAAKYLAIKSNKPLKEYFHGHGPCKPAEMLASPKYITHFGGVLDPKPNGPSLKLYALQASIPEFKSQIYVKKKVNKATQVWWFMLGILTPGRQSQGDP